MNTISKLLRYAVKKHASCLYLSTGMPPAIRTIVGIRPVQAGLPLDEAELDRLVGEFLTLPSMEQDSIHIEKHSAYSVPGLGHFYVHAMRHSCGNLATFRMLPPTMPTLADLGDPPPLRRIARMSRGLVIVVHEHTSFRYTSAALLDAINRTTCRYVITVERPIEFNFENIKSLIIQREILQHDIRHYNTALRDTLHANPDVILAAPGVGELDPDTLSLLLLAAEMGSLVLLSLPGSSCEQILQRILHTYPQSEREIIRNRLAACLQAAVFQCELLTQNQDKAYAYEVLMSTPEVRDLIRAEQFNRLPKAIASGHANRMQSLEQHLVALVNDGLISEEDAFAKENVHVEDLGLVHGTSNAHKWYNQVVRRFGVHPWRKWQFEEMAIERFLQAANRQELPACINLLSKPPEFESELEFEPESGAKSTTKQASVFLGVDIGSSSIKLVEAKHQGKQGCQVLSYAFAPLPSGVFQHHQIEDVQAVGKAIRLALDRTGTKCRRVHLALPNHEVMSKHLTAPASLLSEDQEQICSLFNQHLSTSQGELDLDFVVRPSPEGQEYIDVHLIAVHKEYLDTYLEALDLAGLKVVVAEVERFALERVTPWIIPHATIQQASQLVGLVEIGATWITLTLFEGNKVVYVREIECGGNQLTDEIQQRYGLSLQEAEKSKKDGGQSLPENYLSEILKFYLQAIAQHIDRLVQLHLASHAESQVKHLYLAGGGAYLADISAVIRKKTGIHTSLVHVPGTLSLGPKVAERHLQQHWPMLLKACALTLRSLD